MDKKKRASNAFKQKEFHGPEWFIGEAAAITGEKALYFGSLPDRYELAIELLLRILLKPASASGSSVVLNPETPEEAEEDMEATEGEISSTEEPAVPSHSGSSVVLNPETPEEAEEDMEATEGEISSTEEPAVPSQEKTEALPTAKEHKSLSVREKVKTSPAILKRSLKRKEEKREKSGQKKQKGIAQEPLPDFYAILGVGKNASPEEIKSAYRRKLKENHPDFIKSEVLAGKLSEKDYEEASRKTNEVIAAYHALKYARAETDKLAWQQKEQAKRPATKEFYKDQHEPETRSVSVPFQVSSPPKQTRPAPPPPSITPSFPQVPSQVTQKLKGVVSGKVEKKIRKSVAGKLVSTIKGKVGKVLTAAKAAGKLVDKGVTAALTASGVGALIAKPVGWIAGKATEFITRKIPKMAKRVTQTATALFFVMGSVLTSFAAALATAVGASILIAIFLVSIILFIINTSAFVVPPAPRLTTVGGGSQLSNILIVKSPSPAGPFQNFDLPLQITYTVTVQSLQGTITSVSIQDDCFVSKKNSPPPCPPPSPAIPTQIDTIEQTTPFTFTYKRVFDNQFFDSLITDNVSITADTLLQPGVRATGSAAISIGNPPTDCFFPSGFWPSVYKNTLNQAITKLVADNPNYVNKVCNNKSTVPICFNADTCGNWGCHNHKAACDITLNEKGLTNPDNALYILAHESGHHLSSIKGTYFQQYLDSEATTELPFCSYNQTWMKSEGFAEAIALNVVQPTFWANKCGATNNFSSLYPKSHNFVNSVLF